MLELGYFLSQLQYIMGLKLWAARPRTLETLPIVPQFTMIQIHLLKNHLLYRQEKLNQFLKYILNTFS